MNSTSLRYKQTQTFVKKSLRAISSTTTTTESTLPQGSLMSGKTGHAAVGSTRTRKVSVASAKDENDGDDIFPMNLAQLVQRRKKHYGHHDRHPQPTLGEKWTKLASQHWRHGRNCCEMLRTIATDIDPSHVRLETLHDCIHL